MNKWIVRCAMTYLLCVAIIFDIVYSRREIVSKSVWLLESYFYGFAKQTTSQVSIVRSDDPALPTPMAISDASLTYAQVEEMVRRAVNLVGGFHGRVKAGDKVLIKPNIVEKQASGIGVTTDVRVVKALVRLVNEIAPGDIEIIVGEGSAVPTQKYKAYSSKVDVWDEMWDVSGYQSLPTDPDLAGINFRLVDLNGPEEDLVHVLVPDGSLSPSTTNGAWVHPFVLDADYTISVPVMKVSPRGLTVALKNHIGLYPGNKYGYSKSEGTPQNNYTTKIHLAMTAMDCVDEDIVDMVRIAGTDFTVIDAIMCMEKRKSALWKNGVVTNNVRRNMIIASDDLVAADHVCSRLMGMNPDDMAQITLAEKIGIGVNDPERIEVLGATIEGSVKKFIKADGNTGDFGQSNRTWLVRGIFNAEGIINPMDHEFIPGEATLVPASGVDGWSKPIYFFDDRISLGGYFVGTAGKVVAYAFTYFDAPCDQQAELWLGHDEPLRIYLPGTMIYNYITTRSYSTGDLVNMKVSIPIRQGENTLLVKVFHQNNYFDFALNICEPESDANYDGNRVWGLTFRTLPDEITTEARGTNKLFEKPVLLPNYPNPFNSRTVISFTLPNTDGRDMVALALYTVNGQHIRSLVNKSMSAGHHSAVWDGHDDKGQVVASGLYVAHLSWNNHHLFQKIMFVQ